MPLISVSNISKSYGTKQLFNSATLHLNERERAALIGDNGSGKTTFLRIILGEEVPDIGNVYKDTSIRIGYLPQEVDLPDTAPLIYAVMGLTPEMLSLAIQLSEIEERIQSAADTVDHKVTAEYSDLSHKFNSLGGYSLLFDAKSVLNGLGFLESELYRPIQTLSGGQKRRAALARLLLMVPDLLLLDEPTNHLDISACEWLQKYLIERFSGALLIVSHDRYFLDRVVSRVFEIDDRKIVSYKGNYSLYRKQKNAVFEERIKLYKQQQKEISRIENAIQTLFSDRKFSRRDNKIKQLERIERLKPVSEDRSISAQVKASFRSGKEVIRIERLSMSYPGKTLFENLDLTIERGNKVGIVGPNGSGKTTLLKILAGKIIPTAGGFTFGLNVQPVYFAQEFDHLVGARTVLEELLYDADVTTLEARDLLAKFLFFGDDAFKKVEILSGGETCRLALAKIIANSPNLMLLDEPTNHLDIRSREALERALESYDGTIMVASHDRYLLDSVCTHILEIGNAGWSWHLGNYSTYREKTSQTFSNISKNEIYAKKSPPLAKKRPDSPLKACQRELRELQRARSELESQIEKYECRSAELEGILSRPETWSDPSSREISDEHTAVNAHLETLYREWELVLAKIEETELKLLELSPF